MSKSSAVAAGMMVAALLAGAGPSAAQQVGTDVRSPGGTIRVTGTGEVQVQPDRAEIAFAVETHAETAREAGEENARRMERVVQALLRAGVARDDIETRGYSVFPEYVHEEGRREPLIRGYRATNQMVLATTSLDRVGPLIDVALQAGANRMDGVSFGVRDPEAVRAEALREAVARARESAEAIAGALGVALGPVMDASTSADPIRPMYRMEAADIRVMGAPAPAPTPVQPGEQTVTAFVSLVFAIQGR